MDYSLHVKIKAVKHVMNTSLWPQSGDSCLKQGTKSTKHKQERLIDWTVAGGFIRRAYSEKEEVIHKSYLQ